MVNDLRHRGGVNFAGDERLAGGKLLIDIKRELIVMDLPEMKSEIDYKQGRECNAGSNSDSLWRHDSILPCAVAAAKVMF